MSFKPSHVVGAVLVLAVIVYLVLSDDMEAQRFFNYGVQSYKDERFAAAASYFCKAADLSPNPISAYNAALASWAVVREVTDDQGAGGAAAVSREEVQKEIHTAQEAIGKALSIKGLDEKQTRNLIYLEGRLLAVEGRREEARSRLRDALSRDKEFKPALREIVRLDASGEPLEELVVNLAKNDEPELITEYEFLRSDSAP